MVMIVVMMMVVMIVTMMISMVMMMLLVVLVMQGKSQDCGKNLEMGTGSLIVKEINVIDILSTFLWYFTCISSVFHQYFSESVVFENPVAAGLRPALGGKTGRGAAQWREKLSCSVALRPPPCQHL